MSGISNGIINGNGTTPVIYTGGDKSSVVTPAEGTAYLDYVTPAVWTYHSGAWVNIGGGGGGGGVTSLGGATGAITLGTNLSMVGQQLTVTIPAGGVTSFGGATGAITLGTNLSMVGQQLTVTIPASGVTSFGGATGAITLGTNLSMSGNQLTVASATATWNASALQGNTVSALPPTNSYSLVWDSGIGAWRPGQTVTVFGGVTGPVTLGTNLSMVGSQLTVTIPASGVTSFGGATGAITLGTGLSMSANVLNTSAFIQSGNSFGAAASLGTNDSNVLIIKTNGVERARWNSTTNELMLGTTTVSGSLLNVQGTSRFVGVMGVTSASSGASLTATNNSTSLFCYAASFVAAQPEEVIILQNVSTNGQSAIRMQDSSGSNMGYMGYNNASFTSDPGHVVFFNTTSSVNWIWLNSVGHAMVLANRGQLTMPAAIFTGTSTTAKPQILVEPAGTTSTGWNTAGTFFGANAPSAFAGTLMDLQLNGASLLRFDVSGQLLIGTTSVVGGSVLLNVAGNFKVDSAGNSVGVQATQNQVIVPGSVSGFSLTMTNNATAPGTSTVVLPTSVYGTGASVLTTPATWFIVRVAGADYKVPCY